MGGVAEQRDAALRPVLDRLAVAQHPHPPGLDALEHAQHLGPLALEVLPQVAGVRLRVPALDVALGMEHGDQVVELAAAERIVHEVRARARPQDHVGLPEILRHLVALEHRSIGDMARDQRLAVADDLLAHLRPHAVAADQGAAPDPLARLQGHGDAVVVLLEVLEGAVVLQRDEVVALAGVDEDAVDVVAVGDRVGLLELAHEARVGQRDAGDALARQRATHFHGRRLMGVGEHRVLEPDPVERVEDVGAELDAGADLAELRRLLEHSHRKALARERVRRREPADAAARDQDRQSLTVSFRHRRSRRRHARPAVAHF